MLLMFILCLRKISKLKLQHMISMAFNSYRFINAMGIHLYLIEYLSATGEKNINIRGISEFRNLE